VLPTCGSARFASALGVEDFLRRSHRVRFSPAAAARWAEAAACLAAAEGLPAHAAAALLRGSPGGAGGGGGAGGAGGRGGTSLRRLRRPRRLPSPRRTPLS
jgi:histidinol dehydrogenase